MKTVIFCGPTLSHPEAGRIMHAVCLPPVKQGDVVSAFYRFRPQVIGIIDGMTYPEVSVWHKDILFALERGVAVYGAGAVGAVRAVELEKAGMVGIGAVYRKLKEMEVFAEDEVLSECAESKEGWIRLSEPLVNLRATFESARDRGVIRQDECAGLITAAGEVFFRERTLEAIFERASRKGLGADVIQRIADYSRDHYVDVQKQDAIALLHAIKNLPASSIPPEDDRRDQGPESYILHVLKHHDRDVEHDGAAFPLYSLAACAVLNHPEAEELAKKARDRLLLSYLSSLLGVRVSEEDADREALEFRKKHGLADDAEFSDWLAGNDLLPEDFRNLMKDNARIRKLYDWSSLLPTRKQSTKMILDELRLRNQYREYAQLTADMEKMADSNEAAFIDGWRNANMGDLIRDHAAWNHNPWHERFMNTMALAGVTPENIKAALVKAKMLREKQIFLVADTMTALERAENPSEHESR
ncbi:MAG: hypothetical protein JXL20_12685 [Deltaproteobacteria bacterium]|nr:hypothetical protein [Deltaproteobacteria bacterium]